MGYKSLARAAAELLNYLDTSEELKFFSLEGKALVGKLNEEVAISDGFIKKSI